MIAENKSRILGAEDAIENSYNKIRLGLEVEKRYSKNSVKNNLIRKFSVLEYTINRKMINNVVSMSNDIDCK